MDEEDYLQLSGIQHFAYCPRQWALVHIEGQWAENLKTVEGELMHERSHDADHRENRSELRGDLLVLRDLRIRSDALGFSGACDVVEFYRDPQGVTLSGRAGAWRPFPVEYKRGRPKAHRADELQLCAQAMCLEEMLCCEISEGALFYGETRRRQDVQFDDELRALVRAAARDMHRYARAGHTPKVKERKGCGQCSLKELCLPELGTRRSAEQWTQRRIREEEA